MTAYYLDKRICPVCLGARKLGGEPCGECSGTGRIDTESHQRNEIKLDEQRPMPREMQL